METVLTWRDRLGSWKARWSIGRMRYRVEPGLYAIGSPTPDSHVFVTANYKMSVDRLRSQLGGRDGWIMVLDTKGINVWCAAGKGTYGTAELVDRIRKTGLDEVVSHRTLILPQLGAVGVSAHKVKQAAGFKVVYGPVRAEDLPAFLDAGMKTTPDMRQVRFALRDRLVLVPAELVGWLKYGAAMALAIVLLAGLGPGVFAIDRLLTDAPRFAAFLGGAYLAGTAVTPALLPWLPSRPFSSKGAWAGFLFALLIGFYAALRPGLLGNWLEAVAWLLIVLSVSSFLGMNFTGASTYTSLSGVRAEMRVAVPLQAGAAAIGLALWIISRFV